jgi:hypothetical protein
MTVEETICNAYLPVNTIVFLNRAIDILGQAGTNCAASLEGEPKDRFRKVLWLVNRQVYGDMATIDLYREWRSLCTDSPMDES